MSKLSFAFLIREPCRMRKGMGAIFGLHREGALIRIFLLGSESLYWTQEDKQCLEQCCQAGIELYADKSTAEMKCFGFQVVDSSHAAAMIRETDAVIPL